MTSKVRTALRKSFPAVLVLLLPVSAFASPPWAGASPQDSLRLQGEVVKVAMQQEGQDRNYDIWLKLEFVNTGYQPVILPLGAYGEPPSWWVLDVNLSYSPGDTYPFYIRPTSPANSRGLPSWKKLRRDLDKPTPPPNLTRIIPPGGTFVSYTKVFAQVTRWDKVAPDATVWLTVGLEIWPFNIEDTPPELDGTPEENEFGEHLRKKWYGTGELRLEPILSEPIRLDLAASSRN